VQKYVIGLGDITVDDRLPPVKKPSAAKERHRETIQAWHNEGYDFANLLTVARFLFKYLGPEEGSRGLPDRPPLGGMYAQLATSLLGVNLRLDQAGKPVWRLAGKDLPRCEKRLRSAGINPETWKVFDRRAAAFFWSQVCSHKGHYYSEKEQFRLMNNGENPPDIIPLKFDYRLNEEQAKSWRLNPTQERFKGKIREHLQHHLDGYVPYE